MQLVTKENLNSGEEDSCEAHAKADAETTVFSDTSTGFIVNVLPEVNTDSIGHEKLTLTSNTTSSELALVFL